ncbi:tail fiber protein [Azospirillum aestuarii]|uniref:tail fiber protein n=1 Tax=Azospirillum aestuarii TaxID=2802052 RepID=UPI004054B866
MSWYKVGRVAVINGSAAVVGFGTNWANKFKPGDIFALAGGAFVPYEIVSVADDTHLTLATPFAGPGGDYQPYVVIQNFTTSTNADLAVRVGNLLQIYEAAQAAPEAAVAAQEASEAAAQQAASSAAAALASEEAAGASALAAATSAAQAVVDTTNAIQAEAQTRAAAVTSLGGRIDTVTARVGTAEAAIAQESTLRVAATAALAASLQTEVTRAQAAEQVLTGAVAGESAARADADTALSGAVALKADKADTYTKTQVDAAISAEQTTRATADTALGTRITALEGGKADKTGVYTKAETDSRIQAVVGAAPAALDTLAEIADRLVDEADAVAALTATVAGKAPLSHVGAAGNAHAVATTEAAGFMSPSHVSKLAGVAAGANNYVLPVATGSALGGVKAGANVSIAADGALSAVGEVLSVAGRKGAVVLSKADVGLGSVDNTADSTKAVASAGKLTTARTIGLTGGVTGSVTTDLSGAVSINATVDPTKHSHPQLVYPIDDPGMGLAANPSTMQISWPGNPGSDEELRSYFGDLSPEEAGCRVAGASMGFNGLAPLLIGMQQGIGRLDSLQTNDTTSLVSAINELKALLSGGGGGGGGVPAGSMTMYAGSIVPDGWLECDGREVGQDEYPNLFEAIYDTWGPIDGGTFKLPDMRGFFAIGAGQRPQDSYGVDAAQYGHVSTGDYSTQTNWVNTMFGAPVENSSVSAVAVKYIIKT